MYFLFLLIILDILIVLLAQSGYVLLIIIINSSRGIYKLHIWNKFGALSGKQANQILDQKLKDLLQKQNQKEFEKQKRLKEIPSSFQANDSEPIQTILNSKQDILDDQGFHKIIIDNNSLELQEVESLESNNESLKNTNTNLQYGIDNQSQGNHQIVEPLDELDNFNLSKFQDLKYLQEENVQQKFVNKRKSVIQKQNHRLKAKQKQSNNYYYNFNHKKSLNDKFNELDKTDEAYRFDQF
ncbi:UNKNOWN [Stylonychia lemnae]|uniref:Transmembrane protein n=1 Tax=Stylonychia lemnae TaxID=5949 RepID=A0A077ZXN6_STYLE|nr:UNKNOWN [Stylonychia lemnae]|eukprot:CDW74316.1 UNKNOWN [Stylonychia lemnae]